MAMSSYLPAERVTGTGSDPRDAGTGVLLHSWNGSEEQQPRITKRVLKKIDLVSVKK